MQTGFGGFYSANSARLILAEVGREHGQGAVDRMIREASSTGYPASGRARVLTADLPSSRKNKE